MMVAAREPLIPTVEALIARCLTDPDFLETALHNPGSLDRFLKGDLLPEALGLDFGKLWRFSGFIGKVQHNYLWEHFRYTRHLMWRLGIEHDIFGKYRHTQLCRPKPPADRSARIQQFSNFLSDYTVNQADWLLKCIFTHERTLWELRSGIIDGEAQTLGVDPANIPRKQLLGMVPFVPAHVRMATFDYDPLKAITLALDKSPQLSLPRRRPITLLYVRKNDAQVDSFALDAFSAIVFAAVTGKDSVHMLTTKLRQSGLPEVKPSAFSLTLKQAVMAGFLCLRVQP